MNDLKKYWQKRNFKKTPEPKGKILKTSKNRFVIHDHYALKAGHHHDFRLEMDGVLKSWAVPKGVPEEKGLRHLAIQTEDHPISYYDFEGIVPRGCYGAGKVKIFDKGEYELIERTEEKLVFKLKGKKIKGIYCLVKMKGKENQYLIFKLR